MDHASSQLQHEDVKLFRSFLVLIKPKILFANLLSAASGFIYGSPHFNYTYFLLLLMSFSLVISSACVLNNYSDRLFDAKMKRTKERIKALNQATLRGSFIFAAVMALLGFTLLFLFFPRITFFLMAVGFFVYLFLYTPLKPFFGYATCIGAVSGAMPLVAGYSATTYCLDLVSLLFFLIIFFWQLPHFMAISLYRKREYEAATIAILPLVRSHSTIKIEMLVHILLFSFVSLIFVLLGHIQRPYAIVLLLSAGLWFLLAFRGLNAKEESKWAESMVHFSILVLLVFCLALSLSKIVSFA